MACETMRDVLRGSLCRRRRRVGEIARELGVHRVTFQRWVSGAMRPHPRHIPVLAKALGVSQKRLLAALEATTPQHTSEDAR